jgi:hypothetical protein
MDSTIDGTYALNEAIWTVDLSGLTAATLSFQHNYYSDEPEAMPTGNYAGHVNGDGVSISSDGGTTWRAIWSADSTGFTAPHSFDLVALATAAGMTLGPNFKIKFQQYDNFALTTDGRAWDNILITTPATNVDHYSFALDAGDTVTLGFDAAGSSGEMRLYNAAGTLLATGSAGAGNLDRVISDFAVDTTGTYYVQVSGNAGDYALVVTRNADFDTEANDSTTAAQDVLSKQNPGQQRYVLGYIDNPVGPAQTISFAELSPGVLNGASI